MASLEDLTAQKNALKQKVKQLQNDGAAPDVIAPVYEQYEKLSAQIKELQAGGGTPAPATPAPATPVVADPPPSTPAAETPAASAPTPAAAPSVPVKDGKPDLAALDKEKRDLKKKIKELQDDNRPTTEIQPVFDRYQQLKGWLENPESIPVSELAPSTESSTSTPAPAEAGGLKIPSREELEIEKDQLKGKVKKLKMDGEPSSVIEPVYERYMSVKVALDDYDAYVAKLRANPPPAAAPAAAAPAAAQPTPAPVAEPAVAVAAAPAASAAPAPTAAATPGAGADPHADSTSHPEAETLKDNVAPKFQNLLGGEAEPANVPAAAPAGDGDDEEMVGVAVAAEDYEVSESSSGDPDLVQKSGPVEMEEDSFLGSKMKKRFLSCTPVELRVHKGNGIETAVAQEIDLSGSQVRLRRAQKENSFEVLYGKNLSKVAAFTTETKQQTQEWTHQLKTAWTALQDKARKNLRFAAAPVGFNGKVIHMGWIQVAVLNQVSATGLKWVWKHLVLCDFCCNLYDKMPKQPEDLDENEDSKMELIGCQVRTVTDPTDLSKLQKKTVFYLDSGKGPFYACAAHSPNDLQRWTLWMDAAARRALYIRTRAPIVFAGFMNVAGARASVSLVITRSTISVHQADAQTAAAATAGNANDPAFRTLLKHTFAELKDYRTLLDDRKNPSGLEMNFGVHRKEGAPVQFESPQGGTAVNVIHNLIQETYRRRQARAKAAPATPPTGTATTPATAAAPVGQA